MPKAKKRKGAGKKSGKKAKLQAAAEKDELMKKMRSFIKAYQCRCCKDSAWERRVSGGVRTSGTGHHSLCGRGETVHQS